MSDNEQVKKKVNSEESEGDYAAQSDVGLTVMVLVIGFVIILYVGGLILGFN